ncbi:YcxB family protein [Streptomyces sp. NPDC059010]|uniref:YcxB family protein n=1 Tax=Streptomyces sp. NPDC059010 TaxID=3346695 RepID=UPI0036B32353
MTVQERSTVELAYVPTTADATGALRTRTRATPAGRLQSGIILAGAIVVLGALLVTLTLPKGPHLGLTVLCLAALALLISLHVLVPALQARQVHRMVAPQGEFRAVVGEAGVRLTSQDSETTFRWPMITRYAETDTLFVLMTPDKHSVGIVVLPKRGAAIPPDVDRLRAILDRNAARV